MSDFIEHLADVFADFGTVTARKMFGGYGVYHEGVMFGLVADDVLYLKVDGENAHHFEKEGLPPFVYAKDGKAIRMSYSRAPDAIMDDPEAAVAWAQRSFEAGLRARASRDRSRKGSA